MAEFDGRERKEIGIIAAALSAGVTGVARAGAGPAVRARVRAVEVSRRPPRIPGSTGNPIIDAQVERQEALTLGKGLRREMARNEAQRRLEVLKAQAVQGVQRGRRFRQAIRGGIRQRIVGVAGRVPVAGRLLTLNLATAGGAAAAGATVVAAVAALLVRFQLNMLRVTREAIDAEVQARGLLTRGALHRESTGNRADGVIASWRRWSVDKMNVVGRAFAFNKRLAGALMEGFSGSTAYNEATRAYWESNLELHPVVEDRLLLMRNRFDRQVQEGTFYGGWKTGSSEGPGG